jgi:Uma2 family endonuclease
MGNQAASRRPPATFDDLLSIPEHRVGEILNGELITSPRPSLPHALASSGLGGDLIGPFQRGRGGPGGWWILDEPELHLGGDALVPDLAGWRRERVPSIPPSNAFTIAPDWACEVISPSTEALDRGSKLRIYAREDVRHIWLLNPLARTLEVYRLEHGRWVLLGTHVGDALVRAEPFEAIELDLLPLWGETRAASG